MTFVRIVVGALLVAHGLVHLLYLSPDTKEFSLESSWLLPESARRPAALALMATTVVAFSLVALAVWGVPGLSAAWPVLAITAAAVSAVLLAAFWDWHLVFGIALDVALVAAALTRPEWVERVVG